MSDLLLTSDLQYGFKKGHSTNMCTMVLKETIAYYTSNENNIFCIFLDLTKAFDRVNYCKLFNILLNRNFPAVVTRFLLNEYNAHRTCVLWNGANSEIFDVKNGVRQGGVLSPVLFCLYIDILLSRLHKAGVGCYIGTEFVGSLAYADDVTLLAPTPSAIRTLLRICDEFAKEYSVIFNIKKTKCMFFQPRVKRLVPTCDLPVFNLNNNPIEYVDQYCHLGNLINTSLSDSDCILV